jgi:hypothetical protein
MDEEPIADDPKLVAQYLTAVLELVSRINIIIEDLDIISDVSNLLIAVVSALTK